jgi:hypothetical protein
MTTQVLASFYERDLRKLIDEVGLFRDEEDLWRTQGAVKNSAGNLVLHLIGGLNYLVGTNLAGTGYVRDREQEFIKKGVARAELVAEVEKLILLITKTLNGMAPEQLESDYPIPFDGATRSKGYILIQLSLHLNYHLGQINYLRRTME